jgi:hypothetical protein
MEQNYFDGSTATPSDGKRLGGGRRNQNSVSIFSLESERAKRNCRNWRRKGGRLKERERE